MSKSKWKEAISEYVDRSIRGGFRDTTMTPIEKYGYGSYHEILEYERIDPKSSGLAVDIFIDGSGSYKIWQHPPMVYFQNSLNRDEFEYLPIMLNKKPIIPIRGAKVKIGLSNLNDIKKYILKNYDALLISAEGRGARLYPINENKDVIPLNEMSTLKSEQTGMKIDLWIDDSKAYQRGGHAKRLKFQPSTGGGDVTGNFPSIRLHDLTLDDPFHQKPKSYAIDTAREFVELNKDFLSMVADRQIEYNVFLSHIKLPSDSNINIFVDYLQTKGIFNANYMQPQYKIISKQPSFGYRVVELNGKFNYINEKNELYSNKWYDQAGEFCEWNDDTIRATVVDGNKKYSIYPKYEYYEFDL
jgi:hypothetical protein